jgi:hypothetical protein
MSFHAMEAFTGRGTSFPAGLSVIEALSQMSPVGFSQLGLFTRPPSGAVGRGVWRVVGDVGHSGRTREVLCESMDQALVGYQQAVS